MINAYEYGKALFELAEEQGEAELFLSQLETVAGLLGKHPQYVTLLDTPAIPTGEKPGLIDEAFASCHIYVRDFIKILSENRATGQLGVVIKAFRECLDESLGIVRAEAVTAVPMTEAQCARLTEKLSHMTGKQVILTNRCDASVLGGVTLVCDGTRFDGSIRSRLEALRRSLAAAHI